MSIDIGEPAKGVHGEVVQAIDLRGVPVGRIEIEPDGVGGADMVCVEGCVSGSYRGEDFDVGPEGLEAAYSKAVQRAREWWPPDA